MIWVVTAPDNPRWQLFMGHHFIRAREWARAEAYLRRANTLGLGDSRADLGLARVMEQQARYPEAIAFYDRALAAPGGESSLRAHLGRLVALIEVGRYHDARVEAVRARAAGVDPVPMTILLRLADSLAVARAPRPGVAPQPVTAAGLHIMDSWALVRRDLSGGARVLNVGRRPVTALDP